MTTRCYFLALLVTAAVAGQATGADSVISKRVVYVGNAGTPRARAFEQFLRERFADVRVADREKFEPPSADDADVVLLDWSQRDNNSTNARSPFGPRESWSRPTVLLGSAGHLLAAPWRIIGGSG
jgi:hypothetical protein